METSRMPRPILNNGNGITQSYTSSTEKQKNGIARTADEPIFNQQRFLRNRALIKLSKLGKITVIGAGGIGSSLIQSAAIMGFKRLDIWDYDVLESHNLSTTMYPQEYLNRPKAETAGKIAYSYGAESIGYNEPWTPNRRLNKVVFMCPDNMETRLQVYETWHKDPNRELLVDMRMGALTMEIITVTPIVDHFLESYLPSNQIPDEECTAKHTIFCASVSSGFGLAQAFNALMERPYYAYIWASLSPISLRRKHLVKSII